ncbi:hypothetical protein L810_5907 [Burkholderia sp. AU4i]|nr:hypothetical protein L810_5907 [Burkholderia sp. AU4i]
MNPVASRETVISEATRAVTIRCPAGHEWRARGMAQRASRSGRKESSSASHPKGKSSRRVAGSRQARPPQSRTDYNGGPIKARPARSDAVEVERRHVRQAFDLLYLDAAPSAERVDRAARIVAFLETTFSPDGRRIAEK